MTGEVEKNFNYKHHNHQKCIKVNEVCLTPIHCTQDIHYITWLETPWDDEAPL